MIGTVVLKSELSLVHVKHLGIQNVRKVCVRTAFSQVQRGLPSFDHRSTQRGCASPSINLLTCLAILAGLRRD